MLDIATIVEIIRKESTSRLERGTVIAADPRGTRNVSVRLSGGRACSRPRSCVEGLEPGDEVVVATVPGIGTPVILAKIYTKYEAIESRKGPLAPPDNLSVTPVPAALCVRWDSYPGEDLCWQVRYNSSASDTDATDVLVTRGSYYLHWVVDASGDMDTAAQVYFRVRALRWIGDNNVMFSAWSAWGDDTSGGHNLREIVELEFEDATELTIDGAGAITRTQVYHTVDTAGDAATDDLDTINGGTEGDLLIIRAEDGGHTVVIKHDVDNIWLLGEADLSLDDLNDHVMLIYSSTNFWCDVGGGGGGGGGATTFLQLTDTPADYTGDKGDLLQVNQAENAIEFVTASQDVEVAAAGVATVIGIQTRPVSNEAPSEGDCLQWILDAAGCPGASDISDFWGPSECIVDPTAEGDMLIADDAPVWIRLARGANTNALQMGAANRPEWQGTTDGQAGSRILRTHSTTTIKPKRLAIGDGVNRPDTDGVITLKEIGAAATAIAGQGMLRAGQDGSGETKAWWLNDADDEFELAEVVTDVTKDVQEDGGGDFTTLQAAIDWFKGRIIAGACVITTEADDTYIVADVVASFDNIHIQPGGSLTLSGDTRLLAGMTYIVGAIANPRGLANGGTFNNANRCVLTVNAAGTEMIVGGGTADPDFDADGWAAGDTILVFGDDLSVTECTLSAVVDRVLTFVGDALPGGSFPGGGGNLSDGAAVALLPNRLISSTVGARAVYVPGARGVKVEGFYVKSSVAGASGVEVRDGGNVTCERVLAYTTNTGAGTERGFLSIGPGSLLSASTGNISAWNDASGYLSSEGAAIVAYGAVAVVTNWWGIGFNTAINSLINAEYSQASVLSLGNGYIASRFCVITCNGSGVRGNGGGKAYKADNMSFIYAASTDANDNVGTYVSPAGASCTVGNCNSAIFYT